MISATIGQCAAKPPSEAQCRPSTRGPIKAIHASKGGLQQACAPAGVSRVPQTRCRWAWWRATAAPADLPDLDALLGDLSVPEIDADLASLQTEQGAVFDDDGVVVHYKNDSRALHALEFAAAVADRSHWGRLRLAGEERLTFLHGQSTADVKDLQPGSGCDTVFVTAQARTIDLATVYAQGSGALVVVSPGVKEALLQRFDKYIFPADKVSVQDISSKTCMFSLVGPQADQVLQRLQAGAICDAPYGSHTLLSFQGKPVIVAVGGGLPGPGYTFIADESVAADVWRVLTAQDGVEPMGSDVWQMARVMAGRPAPGSELTEDFNPLEAGLYHAVSVQKGCYIGQETISKVHNLSAVKQQLWGLEMAAPCVVGDQVQSAAPDGGVLGRVTSYIDTPDGRHRALAYLKCKSRGAQVELEGVPVVVAGANGRVVAPPFLSRAFPEGQGEPEAAAASSEELAARKADAQRQKEEEEAAAAAARAEKLRAMQERLAAWQAQQQE
ncbi:hypothetical protein D9Q98_010121 [Chlorella vulgaris]|uniref:GCVT N-terminal domain-containing protein n=1 Tax=Chlorella vulgaris TaxID=3077 RepID=A0A9D4TMX8_CHLVU|nr:hypothetical protein D9Q98_010121 [Chlorella vulgaris]